MKKQTVVKINGTVLFRHAASESLVVINYIDKSKTQRSIFCILRLCNSLYILPFFHKFLLCEAVG